jgi:hypothetical protein
MKAFLRRRGPTIAVAVLMFVAGGATVTTAQNLIRTADIQDGAVTSPKIRDGHVRRADIANNSVNAAKLASNAVTRPIIANNAVNAAKIANNAVTRPKIANNAVNAAKIANGQVTRAKIQDGAVNAAKIADGQVTRPKIANNAIDAARIANGQVTNAKLANNSVNSARIADGSIQIGDLSAAAQDALTAFVGANWGVVDRGVIGNGDSYLRAGPVNAAFDPPPSGIGSLGLRTGSPADKAAFGNEVDFFGTEVSELVDLSYWVFTTQENRNLAPNNMPSIAIEIVPNVTGVPATFSTMVFGPDNTGASRFTEIDAADEPDPRWGLTGAAFAGTVCDINGPRCTFDQLQAYLDDGGLPATILTVQITKGRDFAFSGAVDNLRINDTVYDFEPNGVFETSAAP